MFLASDDAGVYDRRGARRRRRADGAVAPRPTACASRCSGGVCATRLRAVQATDQAWAGQPRGAMGWVAVEDFADLAEPGIGADGRRSASSAPAPPRRRRGRGTAPRPRARAARPRPCPGDRRRRARRPRRRRRRDSPDRPGASERSPYEVTSGAAARRARRAAWPASSGLAGRLTAKIWFGRRLASSTPFGPSITS